jgi:hypothetical protein
VAEEGVAECSLKGIASSVLLIGGSGGLHSFALITLHGICLRCDGRNGAGMDRSA